MKNRIVLVILQLFAAGVFMVSGLSADVYVTGTNKHPADVNRIQKAIAADTTINLIGTFNFGTDGWVWINVPNVTLQAAAGTTAKIVVGLYPVTTINLNSDAQELPIRCYLPCRL